MSIPQKDVDAFSAAVSKYFSFLEDDFQLQPRGVVTVDDDPRDSYVVSKFRQDEFRIDVAWNPFALSLSVLIRIENEKLGRRDRYVYLEPFIEFVSQGATAPLVPQIYPGMTVGNIEKAMQRRKELFAGGVEAPLHELASRLELHISNIRSCAANTIRDYQVWYQSRGKAA
ncbi:MAG: hypothetical protein AAGA03_02865 [Planctomycetota bacterium]